MFCTTTLPQLDIPDFACANTHHMHQRHACWPQDCIKSLEAGVAFIGVDYGFEPLADIKEQQLQLRQSEPSMSEVFDVGSAEVAASVNELESILLRRQ